jgi:hypothetical protein
VPAQVSSTQKLDGTQPGKLTPPASKYDAQVFFYDFSRNNLDFSWFAKIIRFSPPRQWKY